MRQKLESIWKQRGEIYNGIEETRRAKEPVCGEGNEKNDELDKLDVKLGRKIWRKMDSNIPQKMLDRGKCQWTSRYI